MLLKKGNLYTDDNISHYDWLGFTANSIVKRDGSLVMGAGNAKTVRDKWVGIDKVFGKLVKKGSRDGVYLIVADPNTRLFAFQTKLHYKDKSPLHLIERGVKMLTAAASKDGSKLFALPFPGISHGGLSRDVVLELIEELPNNVHVWELE